MQLQFPTGSNHLTKADARILDYISQNTEEFLFLSIGQLANRLQLADATVSRFVRHVGCADYRELRQLVKRQSAPGPGPAAKMAETLNRETGFTLDAWMRRQQLLLQKTLEELRSDQFAQAVRAVQEARHVWIHAKNASASPGQLLFFRARRLGIPVTLLPSGGSELLEGLAQVQQD
ncbi:MAG: MurR/RpiR family transcriptional regulator, partial [Hydrogeniiclostridium sp.]